MKEKGIFVVKYREQDTVLFGLEIAGALDTTSLRRE